MWQATCDSWGITFSPTRGFTTHGELHPIPSSYPSFNSSITTLNPFFLDFPLIIKNSIHFQVGVFFGGLAIAKDEQVIKSNCPNIIVGTPGRILALVRSKKLNLKNLKHFILDECDKMLEQLGISFFPYRILFTNLMF